MQAAEVRHTSQLRVPFRAVLVLRSTCILQGSLMVLIASIIFRLTNSWGVSSCEA